MTAAFDYHRDEARMNPAGEWGDARFGWAMNHSFDEAEHGVRCRVRDVVAVGAGITAARWVIEGDRYVFDKAGNAGVNYTAEDPAIGGFPFALYMQFKLSSTANQRLWHQINPGDATHVLSLEIESSKLTWVIRAAGATVNAADYLKLQTAAALSSGTLYRCIATINGPSSDVAELHHWADGAAAATKAVPAGTAFDVNLPSGLASEVLGGSTSLEMNARLYHLFGWRRGFTEAMVARLVADPDAPYRDLRSPNLEHEAFDAASFSIEGTTSRTGIKTGGAL